MICKGVLICVFTESFIQIPIDFVFIKQIFVLCLELGCNFQ